MESLTEFGKTVVGVDPIKAKLDQTVKKVLAFKPLLARIFKEVVEECHDLCYEEIEACIEGDVLISKVPVDSGLTNSLPRIDGLRTEDYIEGEGVVFYDIRTYLKLPGDNNMREIKLIVNVESQNDDKPGYELTLRELFYCCRMISSQQGVEFTTHADDPVKYGNIKKVYSIWICTGTSKKKANTIEKYSICRKFLYGSCDDNPRYDIMTVIQINLSKTFDTEGVDNELLKLLTDVFDERMTGEQKVKTLKETYGLPVTQDFKEAMDMCTYADYIEKKGIEQGIEQGIERGMMQGIVSLVNDGDITLKRAAEKLQMSIPTFKKKVKEYGFTLMI